jgi:probable rRNA maturation factor
VSAAVEVVDQTGLGPAPASVADLVEAVLGAEGVSGLVAVAFVDEPAIAGLNLRYRGLDEPTDVLAFREADREAGWSDPPCRPSSAGPDAGLAAEGRAGASCADAVCELGEIVVCPAVVHRYAGEEGGDPVTQMGWTLIHGVLHLAGHDHEEDEGEMRERERVLLRELERLVRAVSPPAHL